MHNSQLRACYDIKEEKETEEKFPPHPFIKEEKDKKKKGASAAAKKRKKKEKFFLFILKSASNSPKEF